MKVLIAGGAGYIGSTVASACIDHEITPVILDNLSTGSAAFVRDRIFYEGDIADCAVVSQVFDDHPDIALVIHCAGLAVVPESIENPLLYYRENIGKSLAFIGHLIGHGCGRLLFSSSASIYLPECCVGVDEGSPIQPANPYARTKAMLEDILQDCVRTYPLRVISLRYFNPIGADPAMRTGSQLAQPSHVLSKIIAALSGDGPFSVTGTDWPTRDGSGIRDYVHVWDLAQAHIQAITRFDQILPVGGTRQYEAINLGTGTGITVLELVAAVEAVTGQKVDVRTAPRRVGDTAGVFTQCHRSQCLLGWQPVFSLEDSIRHALQWHALRRSKVR